MSLVEVFKETTDDIIGGSVAKLTRLYVRDYGIDGEATLEPDQRDKKQIFKKKKIRLFCEDCRYVRKCKGNEWPGCDEAKYFFEVIRVGGVFENLIKEVN